MATVLSSPEQRVVLRHVSWETYERLLAERLDSNSPRFTFDEGWLEIMSPSSEHEELSYIITSLVTILAEEMTIDVRGFGSTTFRRADLKRGFEPDSCFYIQKVESISGKSKLDLANDPPPDLVVEIDITSPSINQLPLYAQVGVPEVWRYEGKRLIILKLEGDNYVENDESLALPGVTSAAIFSFVEDGKSLKSLAWVKKLRAWARSIHP